MGEDLAVAEIERRGYAVLERRYRTRFGEIDIVAEDEGVTVFIEVRARRTDRRGSAAESITPRKRRKIAAMALDYLAWRGKLNARCRFDVVAIDWLNSPRQTLHLYRDAFQVDGR